MRNDKVIQACDSKVLYDTEFEAELAAGKAPFEAEAYRCPGTNHYHITHKNKEQRLGYGAKMKPCPTCKQMVKRKGSMKHIRSCNG